MSNSMPDRSYADEATAADEALDERRAVIRRQRDAGQITQEEAAGQLVTALEEHLAAIRKLRAEYFGEPAGEE